MKLVPMSLHASYMPATQRREVPRLELLDLPSTRVPLLMGHPSVRGAIPNVHWPPVDVVAKLGIVISRR